MLGDDVRLSNPANRNAAILNRLDGAGDLRQLARRVLWVRDGRWCISPDHRLRRKTFTALPPCILTFGPIALIPTPDNRPRFPWTRMLAMLNRSRRVPDRTIGTFPLRYSPGSDPG
jgi:hypothetical protein